MGNINKKAAAGFEIVLMMVSIFAFMYFVGFSENEFALVSASNGDTDKTFSDYINEFIGGKLIENETWNSYPISTSAHGSGCCFLGIDGQICGTASPDNCVNDSPFAEGSLCADTSFCEKGCCYDEKSGTYDRNVLEFACPRNWTKDPNCNMPGARLGCCVLGAETIFETRGECSIDSLVRAIGDKNSVDWRVDVGESSCLLLADNQNEGACVLSEGGCKFGTESDCLSYNGDFSEGTLCTSPSLNTSCKMTKQTKCVDGKDQVYFVDSCGNAANVYDSAKASDINYWDRVMSPRDLCGSNNTKTGNADSVSCGNCNRFAGGICASADKNNFKVNEGSFYCKDTSCMFKGESYKNGESWCVYDGTIGNGDDVVGSRHWKYVCSQGVVQVEPCADYRNQICVQNNKFEVNGTDVDFKNAACIANNWRECINLNSDDKDAMKNCNASLNCRVETIDIADKFKFDSCLPKYPGGFDLNSERYQRTAESLCGMASQTCTVVRAPNKWGGCHYVANENCLSEKFGQEMNDFCRGLGDCGGSANIVGKWSGNYNIQNSPNLNENWIKKLTKLSVPVAGQFAKVEDYSKYLAAAGVLLGNLVAPKDGVVGKGIDVGAIGQGISGIGSAASFVVSGKILGSQVLSGGGLLPGSLAPGAAGPATSMAASTSAFAGAAIGAGIGMVVGGMIAKQMGLSSGGSMMMAVGGAMVGYGLMSFSGLYGTLALAFPVGWIGLAIMVIASFFGGSDCPPIRVKFECRMWQAPSGADDCNKCNGNPLKPCSEYRCESLGAGCELINKGSGNELCVNGNPHDVKAPVIHRQQSISFKDGDYKDKTDGFDIVNSHGGCMNAYAPMVFGVTSDEPSQCRFDIIAKDFEDMDFTLGGNSYLYNHTGTFTLPDPSHGQSKGSNWTGDLSLYIKCRDRSGLISPGFYKVNTCVKEGKDKTAPRIVLSEPASEGIVSVNATSQNISVVTNELSSCKWDFSDIDYSDMNNSLRCDDSLVGPSNDFGYVCQGVLPVLNSSNNYYIRCMDQPWLNNSGDRNANSESFVFNLRRPSSKISIDKIKPDSDFEIGSDATTINLKVATSGGGNDHFCSYSFSGYDKMIRMFETGHRGTHTQVLNRGPGVNKIYVECKDETGDFDRGYTEFKISKDTSSPQIARVWQDGGFVNLVLNEDGECKFAFNNCNFAWNDGYDIGTGKELRFAVVRGEKYSIKCKDEFGNIPNRCSVEVMAV